jgi:hypothetical protein
LYGKPTPSSQPSAFEMVSNSSGGPYSSAPAGPRNILNLVYR